MKSDVLNVLEEAKLATDQSDNVECVVMLLKVDGVYRRYSSRVENMAELVANFELAKYDCLERMKQ
jgi:hypothetical protein